MDDIDLAAERIDRLNAAAIQAVLGKIVKGRGNEEGPPREAVPV